MTEGAAPRGWYEDPHDTTRIRLWDGQQWSEQQAPKPTQNPPSGRGCVTTLLLVLGVGFVMAVGIVVAFLFFALYLPYRGAEAKLQAEADRLAGKSARLVGERYSSGSCLDNCPALTRCYAVSDRDRALSLATERLRRRGYRFSPFSCAALPTNAWNAHFTANVSASAAGPQQGSPCRHTQRSNVLVVSLEYRS